MPELPEVETTVRDLRPRVVGRSFDEVEVGVPRMVRTPSPEALKRRLKGRQIVALERRGKYMAFQLDQGALVVHLMMGGALLFVPRKDRSQPVHLLQSSSSSSGLRTLQSMNDLKALQNLNGLRLSDKRFRRGSNDLQRPERRPEALEGPVEVPGGEPWMARDPAKYTRLRFVLDDGSELWLVNPRTLGNVWLVDSAEQVTGRLGPEPLSEAFTVAVLRERLRGHSAPIKTLLLDQGVVAGIGNIYADESLFLAGIRPERPGDELSDNEIARLHRAVIDVLEKGIRLRGTFLGDFLDPFGKRGENQLALNVFRKGGQPCPKCGTTIERKMFRGRGTHFCPTCQK